jgi:hypothetical protein
MPNDNEEEKWSVLTGWPIIRATATTASISQSATNTPITLGSEPSPLDPKLAILNYEIDMYLAARAMLSKGEFEEGPLRNAIVESAVLHARNLCNFFCGPYKKGDLRPSYVLDPKKEPFPALKRELCKAYDGLKDGVNPRKSFSMLVAHMTTARETHFRGYDYHREFSAIDPSLRRLMDEARSLSGGYVVISGT